MGDGDEQTASARFRDRLLDHVRSAVIATDPEGRIVLWNRHAEVMYGWSAEEVLGRDVVDVTPPPENADLARRILASLSERGHWEGEFEVRRRDGSTFPAHVIDAVITDDDGKPVGIVGVSTDLTELKRAHEELYRASRLESVGLLAGGIAHDFNNLLTGISGSIFLARRALDDAHPAQARLGDAERECFRARDLTQQLLTFAKGGGPVTTTVPVRRMLEQAVEMGLIGSRVHAELDVDAAVWPIDADEGQVRQVLQNLVVNARQAMPEGGTLRVTARNERRVADSMLADGPYVVIDVTDQGPGIPPEALRHVFEPFYTTKASGTGLGLTTSYWIAKRHGGSLTVRSEKGRGATFTLTLPALPTARVKSGAEAVASPVQGSGRILVMDDEAAIRGFLREVLADAGFAVTVVTDGEAAIRCYQHQRERGEPFDAVLLDLTIPGGMGGLDVVRRLAQDEPGVRAVVMSGYSNDPVLAEPEAHGFVGSLRKPFAGDEVVRTLVQVLDA